MDGLNYANRKLVYRLTDFLSKYSLSSFQWIKQPKQPKPFVIIKWDLIIYVLQLSNT